MIANKKLCRLRQRVKIKFSVILAYYQYIFFNSVSIELHKKNFWSYPGNVSHFRILINQFSFTRFTEKNTQVCQDAKS